MSEPVKIRKAQIEQTEARVIAAATELFLADGYPATTLTAIAAAAGVGARTVYVRFGTKAALFSRVIDVAIVGDTARVSVLDRPENQQSFAGQSVTGRIESFCHLGAQIMRRTGPLFAVAEQAAALEPTIEADWQRGRQGVHVTVDRFWRQLAADGLLDESIDLDWLVDTTAIIGGAEAYLLGRKLYQWTIPAYEVWLFTTYTQLAGLNRQS
jgi:AcrR family transcriptional regulator